MARTTEPLAEMLRDYSVELLPGDAKLIDAAVNRLEPRTLVSLTWIPGSDPLRMVPAAAKLRRAGLLVMPHIGARHLQSRAQLEELAERLVGDAGIDRILLIGGDRVKPAGPFDSSLAVMKAGVFQRIGISRIAIAGFPEGNPNIHAPTLDAALTEKLDCARQNGIQLSIITQFCFSAAPIVAWLKHLRERGIDAPVRIGLAGPASLLTLIRYAVRCGVGNSLHVLTENPSFAKSLVDRGPEPILREIAACIGDRSGFGIAGLHFYMFGGFNKTLDWIEAHTRKPVAAHP